MISGRVFQLYPLEALERIHGLLESALKNDRSLLAAGKTWWREPRGVSNPLMVVVVLVGLVTAFSRWPFQATLLDSYDAVNYALALDHFDMRLGQPQAPGYPLYIVLGRAFNLLFNDHRAALVWLSTVFSGLAVIAIYLIGREMFGRRAGLIAALLLAASTLFWYLGEVAAPYTTDLFASALVGWLCYRLARSPGRAIVWVGAITLGLVGAFRVQTLMFLLPLFLFALRNRSWKAIISALIVVGVVFGCFFGPAVMVSGGPSAFVGSMRTTVPILRSTETLVQSSRWTRFVKNGVTILRYTFAGLGELILLFTFVGYCTRSHKLRFWRNPTLLFFAIWVLPTWVVYLLIWPGNVGTILVCLPPFFLLAAAGLDWIMERPRWGMAVGGILLAITLVWQVLVFTVLPPYPFGEAYRRFDNYARLEENLDYYRAKLSLVSEIPVEGTVVYADFYRHPQYYLPQYHVFSLPRFDPDGPSSVASIVAIHDGRIEGWRDVDVTTLIPPGTKRVVLFDLPPEIILGDQALVEKRSKNGYSIEIVSIPDAYRGLWTQRGLLIEAQK